MAKDNHVLIRLWLYDILDWKRKQFSSNTSHPNPHFIGNRKIKGQRVYLTCPASQRELDIKSPDIPGHFEGKAWPNWASHWVHFPERRSWLFCYYDNEVHLRFFEELSLPVLLGETEPWSWFKTLWIDPVTSCISSWWIVRN